MTHDSGTSLPTPYYDDGQVTLYLGDCVSLMLGTIPPVDAIVTDPPYGDTALAWDRAPDPLWLERAASLTSSLWCFGSMRFFFSEGRHFADAGWRYAQDLVWEKQNGSGFAADRFKRVHEHAVQYYRGDWAALHRATPTTEVFGSAAKVTVTPRALARTPHTGAVNPRAYQSDGERLMKSVLQVRSEHGRAVHPTQKPLGILRPLIEYSVPEGGVVLDTFSGAGSTLVAARDMGRRAIGIEAREEYCAVTVARLNQGALNLGGVA